jgi:hypothetical protein
MATNKATKLHKSIESAADFVDVARPKVETRYVDALDREVHFRELTGASIDMFVAIGAMVEDDNTVTVSQQLVEDVLAATVCNGDGSLLLFAGPDGREALSNMPWPVLEQMFIAAAKSLGMNEPAVSTKKKS